MKLAIKVSKQTISLFVTSIFVLTAVIYSTALSIAADVPLKETARFGPDLISVKIAAQGTRDTGGNARLTVNLPGNPVAAYLYLAGFDYHVGGFQFPNGDRRVKVKVVNGNGEKTVFRRVPIAYRYPKDKGFINKLDITEALTAGKNRVRVSKYDLDHPDGAVVLAIYRDDTLAIERNIVVHEGADLGWFEKKPSKGPDTELVSFRFAPFPEDREGKVRILFSNAEPRRGDEIFLYTNTGRKQDWLIDMDGDNRLDIVDRRRKLMLEDRGKLKNDKANAKGRLEAVRGAISLEEDKLGVKAAKGGYNRKPQLDVFRTRYTIPALHEFAAFQAQSEDPENGDSLLMFLAVNEIGAESGPLPLPEISVVKEADPVFGLAPLNVSYTATVVSNLGGEPLEQVTIVDDTGLLFTYQSGDDNSDEILDLTETWIYTASETYLEAGIYPDTVTATGIGVESGLEVTDTDDASVEVITEQAPIPMISVTKEADPTTGYAPLDVAYTATIRSSTGNEALQNVTLVDDTGLVFTYQSGDDNGDGVLDLAETWIYTANETYPEAGTYPDTVTASGTGVGTGLEVTDTADALVDVFIGPAIEVIKSADPTLGYAPLDVSYTAAVRSHQGDDPLTNVQLTDNTGLVFTYQSGDDNGDGVLDLAETWIYSAAESYPAIGLYPDTITAVGTGVDSGQTVEDTDDAVVEVIDRGIDIVKTVDPAVAFPGQTVTYTYVVTNTGSTDLVDLAVTDDVLGQIGTIGFLASGGEWTLTKEFTVPECGTANTDGEPCDGQASADECYLKNTATVTGSEPRLGGGVNADDTACLTIVKAGECLGKVSELTLQYNGDEAAQVRIVAKGQFPNNEAFNDTVEAGGQFTLTGLFSNQGGFNGTLGTEIEIYVNGKLNAVIHTSCSSPVGPGLVAGDFLVISGRSKGGGILPAI